MMYSRKIPLFSMVRHLLIILDSFIVSAMKEMDNGSLYVVSDCLGMMICKMQTYYLMLWGFSSLPPSSFLALVSVLKRKHKHLCYFWTGKLDLSLTVKSYS